MPGACRLEHNGVIVDIDQELRKVDIEEAMCLTFSVFRTQQVSLLALQIYSHSNKVYQLEAMFSPTIAFHVWRSLEQETHPAGLSVFWLSPIKEIVASIRDVHMVGRKMLDPCSLEKQTVYDKVMAVAATEPLCENWCPQVCMMTAYQPQQCLLYILKGLVESARDLKCAEQHPPTALCENFRQHLKNLATLWGQSGNSSSHQSDRKPSGIDSYNTLLHTTLLLLKLACLTSSITVETTNASIALSSLWKTITHLCNSIKEYTHSSNSSDLGPLASMLTQPDPAFEAEEERHISALLVQLVMPVFRDTIKGNAAVADTCCKMLLALMTKVKKATYRSIATQTVKSGTA